MRTCRFCQTPETDVRFYDRDTKTGIAAGNCCQPCWVAKSVAWRKDNQAHWNRQRHKLNTMRKFGLTSEEYEALYSNPTCPGCRSTTSRERTFSGKAVVSRLAVDHCHKTGKLRGLLCHDCNRTIATAHDDPKILRRLASYLERHQ